MVDTTGSQAVTRSESLKICLSLDCSLQLDYMKAESLVIVGQNTTVNMFLSLVLTARQGMEAGGL